MEIAALERLNIDVSPFSQLIFDPILFKLPGNEDMPNILDELEIGPPTTELAALERLKYLHVLIMGQIVSPDFLGCFLVRSFNTFW